MPTTIIATNRLLLRSALPQDFEPLFTRIFGDEQVMRHLRGAPMEREEAKRLFAEAFDHEGTGRKIGVLEERASGVVIGYAGLVACDALASNDFEVGFVLESKVWGQGYATEIGRAQLEYGFRTTDRTRMLAQVNPANTPSIRALRKIGMTFHKEYERTGRGAWQVYSRSREA
jgi:[ribosomal protein S5]-alanine N-acetyltransferase